MVDPAGAAPASCQPLLSAFKQLITYLTLVLIQCQEFILIKHSFRRTIVLQLDCELGNKARARCKTRERLMHNFLHRVWHFAILQVVCPYP